MQDNDEREDSGGRDGQKKKDSYAAIVADALDEAEARSATVIVATKTEDGGSSNQEQANRIRPDAFSTFSDDDTRMLTLLGLDPNSNPNEGEQVDWRQLTGFTGRGRHNNQDEGGNINEDGNGTTPRKTRLSFELHHDVFFMLLEDLNLNDNGNAGHGHGQLRRQQGQDQDDQHQDE